jgi:hypothetical protein
VVDGIGLKTKIGECVNRVEVYAIGGVIFWLFIFWILDNKNILFRRSSKHPGKKDLKIIVKKLLITIAEI